MPRRLLGLPSARTQYFGLRGGFLLRWGLFYIVLSLPAIWTKPPPGLPQAQLQQWAPGWFPNVALLWTLAGIIGIVFAFAHRPRRDAFGFIAVVLVPYLWAITSLFLAVEQSSWRQLYWAFAYAAFSLTPWFIAGYRDTKKVEATPGESP